MGGSSRRLRRGHSLRGYADRRPGGRPDSCADDYRVDLPRDQAAADAGVPRFVYVSASSAPPGAPASYMEAKHTAENCLARRPMQVVILRPSLIYGEDQPQSMKDKAQMDRLRNIPFVGRRIEAVRPLAVDLVAQAAVRSALDPSVAGILDIPAIERLAEVQPA